MSKRFEKVVPWGPLFASVVAENADAVNTLLNKGTDVNARTSLGNTPLHMAALEGNLSIVSLLLAEGADVKAANNSNETPLHFAVRSGSVPVARCLLTMGADPNANNDKFETPLHWAIEDDNTELLTLLMMFGGNVLQETLMEGHGAFVAAAYGQLKSLRMILDMDPDLCTDLDEDGNTLLHHAAQHNHRDVVAFLLTKGVPVNHRNDDEEKAFELTTDPEIIEMLRPKKRSPATKPLFVRSLTLDSCVAASPATPLPFHSPRSPLLLSGLSSTPLPQSTETTKTPRTSRPAVHDVPTPRCLSPRNIVPCPSSRLSALLEPLSPRQTA